MDIVDTAAQTMKQHTCLTGYYSTTWFEKLWFAAESVTCLGHLRR
jgi:hypothetical protein